jgi:hypothetical protein
MSRAASPLSRVKLARFRQKPQKRKICDHALQKRDHVSCAYVHDPVELDSFRLF